MLPSPFGHLLPAGVRASEIGMRPIQKKLIEHSPIAAASQIVFNCSIFVTPVLHALRREYHPKKELFLGDMEKTAAAEGSGK
jgi:hypothetical protein